MNFGDNQREKRSGYAGFPNLDKDNADTLPRDFMRSRISLRQRCGAHYGKSAPNGERIKDGFAGL